LLLANTFEDENVNPAQYLLSEKLDGVRAYWDGKNFVSRLGNVYNAPDWFKEGLPANHPLDGELWMDRGKFQETVAIVRQQIPGEGWRKLRYAVFDAPGLEKTPFRYRLEWLSARILPAITPYAFVVPHTGCDGMTHLMNALHAVEKLGGEGLMLRDPESFYEVGRSSSLLKVKSSKDAEAVVIGYEPGKGKYAGQIGSLEVRDANGVTFHVGSGLPDDARRHPYPVGTLITYRYTGLTDNGLPRFPIFLGLCIDKQAPTALQTPEELEHG
jgi:DNA ligase-1